MPCAHSCKQMAMRWFDQRFREYGGLSSGCFCSMLLWQVAAIQPDRRSGRLCKLCLLYCNGTECKSTTAVLLNERSRLCNNFGHHAMLLCICHYVILVYAQLCLHHMVGLHGMLYVHKFYSLSQACLVRRTIDLSTRRVFVLPSLNGVCQ